MGPSIQTRDTIFGHDIAEEKGAPLRSIERVAKESKFTHMDELWLEEPSE